MNVEDFIKEAIGKNILEDNKRHYLNILENTNYEDIKIEYWTNFKNFYENLSTENKSLIFKIIRQVQIDTLSTLFANIDGVSDLDSNVNDLEFKLMLGNDELSGDLQETLLSMDDDSLI